MQDPVTGRAVTEVNISVKGLYLNTSALASLS